MLTQTREESPQPTLRSATADLLRQHDVPEQIKLCDAMIAAYNKVPEKFVLPRQYSGLRPIIANFADDPQGWSEYIRIVRDAVDGAAYDAMHEIYRSISTRVLQQIRRARVRKAVKVLCGRIGRATGVEPPYDEQLVIGRRIELMWKKQRAEAISLARSEYRNNRQPFEDKTEMLDAFWKEIDSKLEDGVLDLTPDVAAEYLAG
jgi:hypothetical protein